ncbi:16S rRNA (cytosine(1402)-N(4))-methyltransferase RsmH [Candidatus Nomurabacteria bacterium]|nr:16S rRNA (cytosine(1402)-N(4))-methyltransferase RsmH [Candidatus Nomurabacteria bacterium]
MQHITVLLHESIEYLNIKPDGIYADGTLGAGGHSRLIADQLDKKGVLIATDLDERSLVHARGFLDSLRPQIHLVHGSFTHLPTIAQDLGVDGYDGILLDLGWNSDQFADSTRGFSFQVDGPLDMRFDTSDAVTSAADIVNTWSQEELMHILKIYADERWAKNISEGIVQTRTKAPIVTTFQLVEIIREAIPNRFQHKGIHPATKTFQALRIAVNNELALLEESIPQLAQTLRPSGRLCIITFHSGEDRIIKHLFRHLAQTGNFSLIEKKGIIPSKEELEKNPRSRSARLRILEHVEHK